MQGHAFGADIVPVVPTDHPLSDVVAPTPDAPSFLHQKLLRAWFSVGRFQYDRPLFDRDILCLAAAAFRWA